MPRAGLSAACRRVTHQNNPDSLIMYGLMCGSLPGTNNGQTSFATLCVLYMRVSLSLPLCVCVKGFMQKYKAATRTAPHRTRDNRAEHPKYAGDAVFMNFFHNASLSGLSGGPSACEFRGNYLQTKRKNCRENTEKSRQHIAIIFRLGFNFLMRKNMRE